MAGIEQVTIRGDAAGLREFADALQTQRVRPSVRAFAIPADRESYGEAIDNGAIEVLHKAGFTICDPATPEPALAKGETGKSWPGEDAEKLVVEITDKGSA